MKLTSSIDKWTILPLHGRIDAFSEKKFFKTLLDLKEQNIIFFALHLKECQFMSLNAFRFLVSTTTELRAFGGDIVLLEPSLQLLKQIDTFINPCFFKIYSNESELLFKTVLYSDWFTKEVRL